MPSLTTAGKFVFLRLLKEANIHFAFGLGASGWGTAATQTIAAPSNGEITLAHPSISGLVVTNLTSATVGTEGTPEAHLSYFVDYNAGKVYLTAGFAPAGNSIQFAYRYGATAENVGATALLNEQARKICLIKSYAVLDGAGIITVDGVTYSETSTPTNLLYLSAWLDPEEYPNGTIREMGIFVNPTLVSGLPPGRLVFLPAEIATPGLLIRLANYPTITRNAATRVQFHHIISLPLT